MIDSLFGTIKVQYLVKCDPAKTGLAWSVFLAQSDLLPAVKLLYRANYFLEDLTAIDAKEGYLAVYHFDHIDSPGRVALRVLTSHEAPELPSIASVYQGAEWHERETTDFYGITFTGNPNPVPLLLAPDMTEHPLQKTEAQRAFLWDLFPPAEPLRAAADFTLLTPAAKLAETGEA
ncbi:NADH-quinone oxidoreductase subunit C [Telmatospirillum siberiense]|nr:NADH-quinone oxidoreductase subunit C [Telmatospirillum siberiense]